MRKPLLCAVCACLTLALGGCTLPASSAPTVNRTLYLSAQANENGARFTPASDITMQLRTTLYENDSVAVYANLPVAAGQEMQYSMGDSYASLYLNYRSDNFPENVAARICLSLSTYAPHIDDAAILWQGEYGTMQYGYEQQYWDYDMLLPREGRSPCTLEADIYLYDARESLWGSSVADTLNTEQLASVGEYLDALAAQVTFADEPAVYDVVIGGVRFDPTDVGYSLSHLADDGVYWRKSGSDDTIALYPTTREELLSRVDIGQPQTNANGISYYAGDSYSNYYSYYYCDTLGNAFYIFSPLRQTYKMMTLA